MLLDSMIVAGFVFPDTAGHELANYIGTLDDEVTQEKLFLRLSRVVWQLKQYDHVIAVTDTIINKYGIATLNDSAEIYMCRIVAFSHYENGYQVIKTLKVLDIINKRSNYIDKDRLNASLMTFYTSQKNYPKAIEITKDIIEQTHSNSKLSGSTKQMSLANNYNNVGVYFMRMEEPDSALVYYQIAYDYFAEYGSGLQFEFNLGLVRGNMGTCYMQKGDYEMAMSLLMEDILASTNIGENVNAFTSRIQLVECIAQLGNPGKALDELEAAKAMLNSTPSARQQMEISRLYYLIYADLGNYRKAHEYLSQHSVLKDSFNAILNAEQLTNLQSQYELSVKDNALKKNEILLAEDKSELLWQRNLRNVLIAAAAILVLFSIFIYINLQRRRRQSKQLTEKNKEIERQKTLIEESLHEKEALLKEIHHRVKNNLQVISGILELQTQASEKSTIEDITREGQNRVRSMALIHQKLYQSEKLSRVKFQEYLEDLCEGIASSYYKAERYIAININAGEHAFTVDTAVPLGLIATELISNSYKHAFADMRDGQIYIDIKALANTQYCLTIADNGVGLPDDFNATKSDSIGLDLVKGLSRQLNGSVSYQNGTGTTISINFFELNEHVS